jgi:hypothetical protein
MLTNSRKWNTGCSFSRREKVRMRGNATTYPTWAASKKGFENTP